MVFYSTQVRFPVHLNTVFYSSENGCGTTSRTGIRENNDNKNLLSVNTSLPEPQPLNPRRQIPLVRHTIRRYPVTGVLHQDKGVLYTYGLYRYIWGL